MDLKELNFLLLEYSLMDITHPLSTFFFRRKENERFALGNILTFGLFQVMLFNGRVFSKDVNEREIIGNVKQAN